MADLSRHLPLSNRTPSDESSVSGDWREALAGVIALAAGLAAGHEEARGFLADARLAGEFPDAALLAVAAAVRIGGRRRISSLTAATRALIRLAGDRDVALDPTTSGAVALYAAHPRTVRTACGARRQHGARDRRRLVVRPRAGAGGHGAGDPRLRAGAQRRRAASHPPLSSAR